MHPLMLPSEQVSISYDLVNPASHILQRSIELLSSLLSLQLFIPTGLISKGIGSVVATAVTAVTTAERNNPKRHKNCICILVIYVVIFEYLLMWGVFIL
jgi:hypothetical protein